MLHGFAGTTYLPLATSLVFVASRLAPHRLVHVTSGSQSLAVPITPRSGCVCYQPSHSNTIFIFGGFYRGLNNYMHFQTDITLLQVASLTQVHLENIPKSFFRTVSWEKLFDRPLVVAIHNDWVRPRTEFQILRKQ